MAAHGKLDKQSKRHKPNRRIAKVMVVKVALVGRGARERLMDIGVAEQVLSTASKEGTINAVKTALKLSGDVIWCEFEKYGLVRDDKAKGTVYSVAPKRQTTAMQCRLCEDPLHLVRQIHGSFLLPMICANPLQLPHCAHAVIVHGSASNWACQA
jgi:hypothetical protein